MKHATSNLALQAIWAATTLLLRNEMTLAVRLVFAAVYVCAVIPPTPVYAIVANTCGAIIFISYPDPPAQTLQGTVAHVRLQLGAARIDGGTELSVKQVLFDLGCRRHGCSNDVNHPCTTDAQCGAGNSCLFFLPGNCAPDGSEPGTNTVVGYLGNLVTNCTTGPAIGQGSAVTFTTNSGGGNTPNEVVFTADATMQLFANTSDFCHIDFDVEITDSMSHDDTPTLIEERGIVGGQCDNGLAAAAITSGSIVFSNTATATATPTQTPTPTAVTAVDLGTAAAQPGGIACVPAQLRTGGVQIAGTGNDVGFDSTKFSLSGCAINPQIGGMTTPDKQLSEFAINTGLERIGIFGLNLNLIPDGTLYACTFSVGDTVINDTYTLANVASASDVHGNDLSGVGAAPGHIIVTTCTGDCNGNGMVTIGEVIRCVSMFLGAPLCDTQNPNLSCPVADANVNGGVSIGEVVQCANRFLMGCS